MVSAKRRKHSKPRYLKNGPEPVCAHGNRAVLTSGATLFKPSDRRAALLFYVCAPCGCRVGAHIRSAMPFGIPCDPATARARNDAHRQFDGIWKSRAAIRGTDPDAERVTAYRWLARELGIRPEACHISWFDLDTCRRVEELCRPVKDRLDRESARGRPDTVRP